MPGEHPASRLTRLTRLAGVRTNLLRNAIHGARPSGGIAPNLKVQRLPADLPPERFGRITLPSAFVIPPAERYPGGRRHD